MRRFSIRSALVVIVILALVLALVAQQRRAAIREAQMRAELAEMQARADLERARAELERLTMIRAKAQAEWELEQARNTTRPPRPLENDEPR